MKNKGFTLIETIVVFGILSALALVGVESIIEFQKNALLDTAANEFASTLRTARTKSIAGELLESESYGDFADDGLPKYGIRIEDDQTYFLIREYIDNMGIPGYDSELEKFTIDDNLSLANVGDRVFFERITGEGGPISFTLQRIDGKGTRIIEVNDQGVIIKQP